ncbi:MAG: hypothetical protein ACTSVI_01345 [Promethearchaeota archaeon]
MAVFRNRYLLYADPVTENEKIPISSEMIKEIKMHFDEKGNMIFQSCFIFICFPPESRVLRGVVVQLFQENSLYLKMIIMEKKSWQALVTFSIENEKKSKDLNAVR